ncbi:MAG: hypothetical protein II413_06930 [Treponema sp.]|nr:hypothetical protein [Treponema sp.]
MEQTYSKQTLVQAGFDITKILMDMASRENDGNSFLRSYLDNLTSEDGIYKKQSEALQDFSDTSLRIRDTTQEILESIQKSSVKIDGIYSQLEELNRKMDEIQKKRHEMDREMNELEEFIKKIRGFVENIQNISDQTNLLSFNASIEAAHAGSAGAGFRIIANEVKKLSEQMRSTSLDIGQHIEELNRRVVTVVRSNAQYDEFLNQIRSLTKDSSSSLEEIKTDSMHNADATESMYQDIKANQENIMRSSKEVEHSNIMQVNEIVRRETEASIMMNDRLSFLLQMNNLFDYIQNHKIEE